MDSNGQMIHDATVHFQYYDLSNPKTPALESEADAVRLETPDRLTTVFANERKFDRAGNWGVVIQARLPDGSVGTASIGFQVLAESPTLKVGQKMPVLDTPTAGQVNDNLKLLTSSIRPNPAFYRTSLAQAVRSGKPTLLLLSTPAYCTSRMCGPAYDTTGDLQKLYGDRINFVSVEVYTGLPNPGFHAALRKAGRLARDGWLVVFGIKPDRPETGYGYIRRAVALGDGAFEVGRFVEKPDKATAARYLESGEYLWNSGIFVWKAETILGEIRRQMPGLYKGLRRIRDAMGAPDERERMAEEFGRLKPVSIDYGVMEKASRVAVLPVDFGWSDLGSWDAVGEVIPPDADGNVTVGRVVSMGCRDTTVYAENRLVATVGLTDAVVVDTPDATLVCRKDMAQNVKDVVGVLRERGYGECVNHCTVQRPWGSYTVLQAGPMYKIKRIEVKPGHKLSHQMHYHRSEHWIVVSGTARVTNGEKVLNVHVNESTYIPKSTMHRLENPGKLPLQIIEVQNGEYLEEDDIVRFDDVYGRA